MFSKCATGVKINNIILLDTLPSVCFILSEQTPCESWVNVGKPLWTISDSSETSVPLSHVPPICPSSPLHGVDSDKASDAASLPTSQAVSCRSSHSGYSSLLPELRMHPVFLRKHQNQMWSLYAVEMAVWVAGLGHVLHASDKKLQTQCKSGVHHVVRVENGSPPLCHDHISITD